MHTPYGNSYTKLLLLQKAEIFELSTPCYMEQASDKKTSRQQVLGLRSTFETEVLLQFECREIAQEWIEDLRTHVSLSIRCSFFLILLFLRKYILTAVTYSKPPVSWYSISQNYS